MKIYRSKKSEKLIIQTYNKLLSLWGTEYEERDIETVYGLTHVIMAGKPDGKPIILFHGVGDDSALMWIYNAKELAKDYRLYAIDTIGGPGKSRPNDKYNKDFDDVIWINGILDGLNLLKVDIVGVSNGGYLAQLYKLKNPNRVDKVISISSCVPAGRVGSPLKTMMKIFLPEALFPTNKNVLKLIKKLSGKYYNKFTDNELIMEHYKYLLKGFNNMAMGFHKVKMFTDEQIESIRDSIYYIIGEEDPFAQMGGKEILDKYSMNVTYFKNAGHGINHELSNEINDLIKRILS